MLKGAITEIDSCMRVTIAFSNEMFVPKNVSLIAHMKALSFEIQQGGSLLPLVTAWTVTSYLGSKMVLQLTVYNGSQISQSKVT